MAEMTEYERKMLEMERLKIQLLAEMIKQAGKKEPKKSIMDKVEDYIFG